MVTGPGSFEAFTEGGEYRVLFTLWPVLFSEFSDALKNKTLKLAFFFYMPVSPGVASYFFRQKVTPPLLHIHAPAALVIPFTSKPCPTTGPYGVPSLQPILAGRIDRPYMDPLRLQDTVIIM